MMPVFGKKRNKIIYFSILSLFFLVLPISGFGFLVSKAEQPVEPGDPAQDTAVLKILNPHEHPQKGETWVVNFQTQGKDTLTIIPKDKQTVDDIEYLGLYCGDKKINPVIIANDSLVIQNWECEQTARVEHRVLVAGDHELDFQFKNVKETAHNSAMWLWAKRLGGTTNDSGNSIAVDSNDNIIFAGYSLGNSDVNGDGDSTDGGAETASDSTSTDAIISVFDSTGNWKWAKRFGGSAHAFANSVAVDSNDNIIVILSTSGNNIDVNGDGDYTDGGAESASAGDIVISTFDSSGTWQWAKRLGGSVADAAYSIAVDSNDNIVTSFYSYGAVDVNGDGDYADGGAESASGYGSYDVIVTSFSSSGTWRWAKRLGGAGLDSTFSVNVDGNNNVLVAASINGNGDVNGDGDRNDGGAESASGYGSNDIVVSVFNESGTWRWAKRLGGTGYEAMAKIAVDGENNVIIELDGNGDSDVNGDGDRNDGGAESASGYGSNDIVVSVFNSSGTWQWAKRIGGTGSDQIGSISVDSHNNIVLLGSVAGNADVNGDGDSAEGGAESSIGYGDTDMLVSVFSSSGTWQWAKRLGGTGSDTAAVVTIDSNDNIILTGTIINSTDFNGDGDSTDGGAESSVGYGSYDILISVFHDYGRMIDTDNEDGVVFKLVEIEGVSYDDFETLNKKEDSDEDKKVAIVPTSKPEIIFNAAPRKSDVDIHTYELRIQKTDSKGNSKESFHTWIDDIEHKQRDYFGKEIKDGYSITYKDGKIRIKINGGKYRLDNGTYALRIRAYDNFGNHVSSAATYLKVDDTLPEQMTLTNIGPLAYESGQYERYYYTENAVQFKGTSQKDISFFIDNTEHKGIHTEKDTWTCDATLSNGDHQLVIGNEKFVLTIDPTGQSFPDSLKQGINF